VKRNGWLKGEARLTEEEKGAVVLYQRSGTKRRVVEKLKGRKHWFRGSREKKGGMEVSCRHMHKGDRTAT